jgi:hypothetical protein
MTSSSAQIKEWLLRVADDVNSMRQKDCSSAGLLDLIRQNYEVLNVMRKVALGTAYMRGISPPKGM